jgi:hypothetical protein
MLYFGKKVLFFATLFVMKLQARFLTLFPLLFYFLISCTWMTEIKNYEFNIKTATWTIPYSNKATEKELLGSLGIYTLGGRGSVA